MKSLELVLLISLVISSTFGGSTIDQTIHFKTKRSLDSKLSEFLNTTLRYIIRNGNETLGIPVLDPLQMEQYGDTFEDSKIIIEYLLNQFTATGLSDYIVTESEVNVWSKKIKIGMKFPSLTSSGFYTFDSIVLDRIPVYGEGEYKVYVGDFAFIAEVTFSIFNGLAISSLHLQISLEELQVAASGIYNDESISNFLSVLISDVAPQFVHNYHDELTAIASQKIIDFANEKLKDMTLKDLLEFLG